VSAPAPTVDTYRAAHAAVLARIAGACRRVGRAPSGVTLVAVSKTVDPDRLRQAVAAGVTTLGENRVQEAEAKVDKVEGVTWHLVGPLQSNKARRALEVFDVIETVDSVALAERLDRIVRETRGDGVRRPVLLQVNVDADPTKAGFSPTELPVALDRLATLDAMEIRGLMKVVSLVFMS
jgi:pyridoxal phosphate enzyme (YggS family)